MSRHSNLFHEIRMRPVRRIASNVFFWSVVIVIAVGIIFTFNWFHISNVLAADDYYGKVRTCLSDFRMHAMYSAAFHYQPSLCLDNPLALK